VLNVKLKDYRKGKFLSISLKRDSHLIMITGEGSEEIQTAVTKKKNPSSALFPRCFCSPGDGGCAENLFVSLIIILLICYELERYVLA
jgi:hypothetical protein